MQVLKQCVGSLHRLNYSTHKTEVNYMTQILSWIRITLLSLLQEKILYGLLPMTSKDTAGTELLSGIFSEAEQCLKSWTHQK